ncbi:MAG TPA: hypothetical protein VK211_29195 [Kamptonema sp.]|nr:hypothetical protein [Kamptonema sp.]
MQLGSPTVINIPQGDNSNYKINREELLSLREKKILNDCAYIYFALTLDYPNGAEGMHITSFCNRWEICEPDAVKAIAQLEKKGAVRQKHQQLSFQFTYE